MQTMVEEIKEVLGRQGYEITKDRTEIVGHVSLEAEKDGLEVGVYNNEIRINVLESKTENSCAYRLYKKSGWSTIKDIEQFLEENQNPRTEMRRVDISVRPILIEDMPSVLEMDEISYNHVYEMLEDREVDEFGNYAYGIFVNQEMIGYCTVGGGEEYEMFKQYRPGDMCLSDVFIKEGYRNQFYGSFLVQKAIAFEKAYESESNPYRKRDEYGVFATLLDDNLIQFYARLGFGVIDPKHGVIYKS